MLHRYPDKLSCYLEADLPQMVGWKSQRLLSYSYQDDRHRIVPINIIRSEGELSLQNVLSRHLNPDKKTLVITEGLVNYFQLATIEEFWQRLNILLADYPKGIYLFEVWPELALYREKLHYRGMLKIIELLTRQQVPLHYASDESIHEGILGCGFQQAEVYSPKTSMPLSPFRVVKAQA